MQPETVLVLDANERAALAVARSLTRAGHTVYAADRRRYSLAGAASGVRPVRIVADALEAPRAFAAEVAAHCARLGVRVLLPITDGSLEAVLEHRAELPSGVVLPFASLDVYRAASDKLRVHEAARASGIAVDGTVVVADPNAPAPSDAHLYPGVVKPHRSVVGDDTRQKLRVRIVDDVAQCEAALRALPPEAFPVLVQRRVRGPGEGVFVARWKGRTIARFAHRRLREKPPAGGVSVFRRSIALPPDLLAACDKLLDSLDWEGVAMIEGKRDLDNGGWCVMEINGRFWGSLQLAIDAGVDFPALLVAAALGTPSPSVETWRDDVRTRWEWGDVDHLLLRMIRSAQRLQLPSDAPSRFATLLEWCAIRPGRDHLEVLKLSDPGPFVVESLQRAGVLP